jgi:subtilisin family serine protease
LIFMKLFFTSLYFVFFTTLVLGQATFSNSSKMASNADLNDLTLMDDQGYIHALAYCSSNSCDSELLEKGIKINGHFGPVISIQLKIDQLESIQNISCITYIEVSSRSNSTRFKNDIERQTTSVDKVQNGLSNGLPMNYSGKGVVVGIVDVGFQCNNPTFFTADGKRNRIVRYWQQSNKQGPAPSGYNYGTELIDSNSIIPANDLDGSHATHVAGIAAGSGYSTPNLQYRGMAPEAELVFVSIKYSNDTLGGSALGDYVVANPTILDAYKYIFDYAESVGKPAVINLSWGMHTGPHDGSSLFDIATESLVGKGKILVGANGNEGDNNMHWNYQFKRDTASTIIIENNRQWRKRESVYSDFWGSKNSNFAIQIEFIDTSKKTIAKTPFINSASDKVSVFKFNKDSSTFSVAFVCGAKNPLNQKPNITVMADHQNQRKYAIIAHIISDSSLVHAWNSGATKEWTSGSFTNKLNKLDFTNSYINGNTNYTAGENGGSSKAVISVGALAARSAFRNVKGVWVNDSGYVVPVNIARFSSKGPSVDGRIKPNISAPGFDVPSAVNNKQFGGWMLDKTLLKSVFRNDTQYWSAFNGTSMAAPHVAGIVALILQANPNLTAAQVKIILETTATVDQNTGSVPNNTYGYGKVNAYNAVLMALQYAGINALNKGSNLTVYPNPFQYEINVVLPSITNTSSIELFSLDGKLVKSLELQAQAGQDLNIQTSTIEKGIYILKFTNGGEIFIMKLVKN